MRLLPILPSHSVLDICKFMALTQIYFPVVALAFSKNAWGVNCHPFLNNTVQFLAGVGVTINLFGLPAIYCLGKEAKKTNCEFNHRAFLIYHSMVTAVGLVASSILLGLTFDNSDCS